MNAKLLFYLLLVLGVFFSFYTSGQIVGDYRSFGAGTNWTTAANWERCAVAGIWPGVASATFPGQIAAVAGTTVTIRDTHTRIIAANIPNPIVNLLIGQGATGILSVGAAAGPAVYNLTCTGSVTINTGGTLNSAGDDVGDFHTLNFQSTLINNGTINFTAATDQITLNVTAATTNNGTLTFATNLGVKTFIGSVSNTGTWTSTTLANTANLVFRNGVSSTAGTFAAGGATFNTNTPRSIGGTAAISFSGVVTVAAGIAITNDNTNTVTMSNAGVGLASGGVGSTFTQGTTGNTLAYAGTSIGVATFTASGAGNTVNYNGGAAQAVSDVPYNNLTVSGTNTATWTLGANRTVGGNLTISSGTLTTAGNQTLDVTGTTSVTGTLNLGGTSAKTLTGDVTLNAGSVWNETAVAAINYGGSLTNNATTFTANTGIHTFTGTGETLSGSTTTSIANATFSGATTSYTNSGTFTSGTLLTITAPAVLTNNSTITATTALSGTGTLTQGAAGILNIGGTSGITTLTAAAAGNTVNYNGGAAQVVKDISYSNLTISGTNTATWTLGAGRTVGGNLTVSSGTLTTAGNQTLGVTGTTSVTGTLNLGGTSAKTFTGDVTLNAGSVWNETAVAAINYGGSLTNNATTFTANTGIHTFTGTGKTLSGSTTTSIANATFSGATTSYTNSGTFTSGTLLTITAPAVLTNNSTITATTALSGTGTLTQGAAGILNIGGTSTITTLTATAAGNTVNYTGAAQTVKTAASNTYYNLGLSGSGNKAFLVATTISGDLSISGAVANLGTGLTHTANTLTLGGTVQVAGSHGSTASAATNKNNTYFLSTSTGIVNICVELTGQATTYYSRNTTLGGDWDDPNAWTLFADGTGGPLAAGVWPKGFDNVVIRAGHTITVNAISDNKGCGTSPDGLLRTNVGPFTSSATAMFYQTGDILIDGTLSVTTAVNLMIENYTHITSTGNLSLLSRLVNLGYLEADASATLTAANDIVLAGFSTTTINNTSTAAGDLIISFLDATLCGTGSITLTGGAASSIVYENPTTAATHANQICSTVTVNCSGVGCTGFPVTGAGSLLVGNTGPGGVGNSTNNKLWLRANDLVLANGAAVASWSDVSGNALTATNAAAGEQPTFATNSANGFPSLTFDGTTDNLSLGAPAALNFVPQTDSWSFLIAYKAPANGVSTTPNQGTLFSKAYTGNRNYQYQVDDISVTNSAFASYIGNALDGGTVTINTNAWVVSSHTNTTATKTSFSNEATNFSGIAIVAGAEATTEVLIGARRNIGPADGSEGFLFTGSIAEIMMYNRVVNAAQRIIISDYLAAKYAVTLSANDFYTMDDVGNGDFDYEVAGIGQATDGSNHRDALGTGIVRVWNPNNLGNGEFLIWGHDNATLSSSTTTGVGAPIEERLSRTWRVSELGGDVGTVSVSFDISSLSGTPLGSNLRLLIDRDNDGFGDNDVTPISGTFVDNTVVFSGVNFQDDDKFTLGNTDVTKPLPIELISFSAKLNNDVVELKWSTASELNNNFFTIERASNIEEFEAVGNPIAGKGTTAERNN